MAENKLALISMDFSVNIFNVCKAMKGNSVLTNQLLRSGTSIGANIYEANYAHGKAASFMKREFLFAKIL